MILQTNLQPETVRGQGTTDDRKDNIGRLLNFFPVIGEDTEGKMVELDAASVLSIPRALKSQEVVSKGFMCNFLFRNISNVFGAPSIVREIVDKLTPAAEVQQKKYEELTESLQPQVSEVAENKDPYGVDYKLDSLVSSIREGIKERVIAPVADEYGVKKGTQNRLERQVEREIEDTFDRVKEDYK